MSYDGGSYNSSGFKIFIFSIVFSFSFFIYICFVHEGINLKEIPEGPPMGSESTLAGASGGGSDSSSKVDVSAVTQPWLESADMVVHGQKLYQQVCALCHGPKGLGDGVAGRSLPSPPRNFVEGKWKSRGTAQALFEVLQKGQGQYMASFAHLPKNDRWALVHYIRSLTQNKVSDDPGKLEAFGKTVE